MWALLSLLLLSPARAPPLLLLLHTITHPSATMKIQFILFLLCSSALLPIWRGYGKLLGAAHRSRVKQGSSLGRWARVNKGPIAAKALTAMISTLGLVGTVELLCVAKEGASPSDASSIDSMIASLLADDNAPKTSSSWMTTEYPYIGGCTIAFFTLFSCTIRRCFRRFCLCKKDDDVTKNDGCEMADIPTSVSTNPSPAADIESCLTTTDPAPAAESESCLANPVGLQAQGHAINID